MKQTMFAYNVLFRKLSIIECNR